jgi:hypothetical protein
MNLSNHSSNPLTDDVGAKAIEVAAMLGDSVVDVKHCTDPQGGKVSSKTWGLAAAGLACVLFSAASFGISVNTAARHQTTADCLLSLRNTVIRKTETPAKSLRHNTPVTARSNDD